MDHIEFTVLLLFFACIFGSLYYTVRLFLVTQVWRIVWAWFIGAVVLLGLSRGVIYFKIVPVFCSPYTWKDNLLFQVMPIVGAFCLMMALRRLYHMFDKYMNIRYLRREIKWVDKLRTKGK